MKSPYDVLIRPVLSEKTYDMINNKRYTFIVDSEANKYEIKDAVETVFAGVQVEKINTVHRLGKMKRMGRHIGRKPSTKKAYITLKKDSKPIDLFEGIAQ